MKLRISISMDIIANYMHTYKEFDSNLAKLNAKLCT